LDGVASTRLSWHSFPGDGSPGHTVAVKCLALSPCTNDALCVQEALASIAYDKGQMKKFFVYALAILSGLFAFGVGIYRGLYNTASSQPSMATILIHAVTTSILIALGGASISWALQWIRKQKKPSQDREISN
jgi:hypothetical protein